MKKFLSMALGVVLATCLSACGSATGGNSIQAPQLFDGEAFVNAYNDAAEEADATTINPATLKSEDVDIGEYEETGEVVSIRIVTVDEGQLESGVLMISPDMVITTGTPSDSQMLLAEYRALVMAATGMSIQDADKIVDELTTQAHNSDSKAYSMSQDGYGYAYAVGEGEKLAFTIFIE